MKKALPWMAATAVMIGIGVGVAYAMVMAVTYYFVKPLLQILTFVAMVPC